MGGMAQILFKLGYNIQGSDSSPSFVTQQLQDLGIKVYIGHDSKNIENVNLLVKSTAIKDSNPELIAAKQLNITIVKRGEMLAEIMRLKHCIVVSGTHGKTTTTSLIGMLLNTANLCPTLINGGIINSIGTNARLGTGEYLVAEGDESDGTFLRLPGFVKVITNIDPEHLDYYGSFENVITAYLQFIETLPFYGSAILCYDHEQVYRLGTKVVDRSIISYGIHNGDVDIKGFNIRETESGVIFDVSISRTLQERLKLDFDIIQNITTNIYGLHNVQNAMAAIAVGLKLSLSPNLIQKAFENFQGVKRRFTRVGMVDDIIIIDDYAHHPAEIIATLQAAKHLARISQGKVIAVMQPHRYSRLQQLMYDFSHCFKDADHIYILNVYAAGEEPIHGVDSRTLVEFIQTNAKQGAHLIDTPEENLATTINSVAEPGDIVIFLGAGNITTFAHALPDLLMKLRNHLERG